MKDTLIFLGVALLCLAGNMIWHSFQLGAKLEDYIASSFSKLLKKFKK